MYEAFFGFQLKQRIALRCFLRAFQPEETQAYVNSRRAIGGLPEQAVMSAQLIDQIHFRSQGIPRMINAICDNLLLTAFAMESRTATLEMLDEVSTNMRLEYPGRRGHRDDMYTEPIPGRFQARSRTA